ncbi:MAG TPA: MG2 domain-containing protein, partial [Pyrinomonadaceae bacterium]|nr:MG2 domain-containing protein [Pyrinomonadaceae bacterium]
KLTDQFGQELGQDLVREFTIAPDEPQIWAEKENEGFATLDPAGKPYYSVLSEGFKRLRVKVYAVTPEDFAAYVDFLASKAERSAPTIGKLVVEKKLKVGGKRGEARELKIGLAPAMPVGTGHAIVVVEPEADSTTAHKQRIVMWLQSTKIGVDAVSDQGKLVAYVSDLMTGKPLDDVGLTLAGGATTASDITGLARLDLPELNATGDWLIARRGTDSAILLAGYGYRTNMTWMRKRSDDQLKWFVFDDRALYRPGETVAVKGYIRRFTGGAAPDIDELRGTVSSANWVLRDPLANELSRGTVMVKEFGAFDMTIKLPDNVNLGRQKLEFKTASQLDGADFDHYFRVEEFRRPDFEVKAKPDSAAPYQIGGSAVVAVNANYYSGGPLAGAESTWTVKSTPTTYTPPNRDDFTFGEFEPWWTYRSRSSRNSVTRTIKGKTDAAGRQRIAIDFAGAD